MTKSWTQKENFTGHQTRPKYLNRCFTILAIADTMRRKSRVERRARTRIEVDDVFQESWAESSQCSSGLPSTLLWSLKWGALERERMRIKLTRSLHDEGRMNILWTSSDFVFSCERKDYKKKIEEFKGEPSKCSPLCRVKDKGDDGEVEKAQHWTLHLGAMSI